jgi:hypothetical protein
MIRDLLAQALAVSAVPFGIGAVLTLLDVLRAWRGWAGRRRWLTFAGHFATSFGFLYLGALIVLIIPSLVLRTLPFGAYLAALALALLQAAVFVVGVLVVDMLLRGLAKAGGLLGRPLAAQVAAAPPNPADPDDAAIDALLRIGVQAQVRGEVAAPGTQRRNQRLDDQLNDR